MGRTAYLRRRRVLPAVAVAAALALTAGAQARAAPFAARLAHALTAPGVSWQATGAVAVDLRTGRAVFARNGRRPLRPASNEKLPVAVAALDELGSSFRIPTRVLGEGRLEGSVWRGRLILKGYGDPTLALRDLTGLARRVRAAGIRRVTGWIVGDESYFDRRRTAPGWKPSFYKQECPPLSALVVAEGTVGGRTVDDPALAAARAFTRALRTAGIRVPRGATTGVARAGALALATVVSPPLARIVRRMNLASANFVAESLLKQLGARERGRGTTAAGALVVRGALRARGIPLAGVRIADGSGLSRYDRLTARAIAALLVSAWRDPAVRGPLAASLPVAGVNGTLADRLERPPARGHVRAKTGTTREASSLSGYVRRRYVFSILQNGDPIPTSSARRGQDRFVQLLAAQ